MHYMTENNILAFIPQPIWILFKRLQKFYSILILTIFIHVKNSLASRVLTLYYTSSNKVCIFFW